MYASRNCCYDSMKPCKNQMHKTLDNNDIVAAYTMLASKLLFNHDKVKQYSSRSALFLSSELVHK